jgi:hypothetical protein
MTVAQTGVEQLYERNAGPVFAYCYARVGSRSLAEWAVAATFDRARAALSNGGMSEPELDWLLRTADKFCAPRLRVDGAALGESVLVLQDWRGRSFDEIEAELAASQARLEEARNRLTPWRRLLGALNLGPALSWAKGLLGGVSAIKATAAAVAVVGAIAIIATPLATKLHDAVRPGSSKPTPSGGAGAPSEPARGTAPASTQKQSGRAAVPAALAGGAAGAAGSNGLGSSASATTTSSAATAPSVQEGQAPGGQGTPAGSAPARQGGTARPAGAAAPSGETAKTPEHQTTTPNPVPGVKLPTLAAPTPTTPDSGLPQTPTVSTPTVPSVSDVTPTVPSLPDAQTPTVPSVSTPGTPTVPDVPSPGGAPSPPSVPSPPKVTTPSVPPPPKLPAVTVPAGH